ncbi:MAG TPA: translocation/assembly module TamB domain-containing protein, partial [Planctomycetota bacterium]|nr:translocation/assembly module TamB domain-containing protein [Planctomycetota bacterium]
AASGALGLDGALALGDADLHASLDASDLAALRPFVTAIPDLAGSARADIAMRGPWEQAVWSGFAKVDASGLEDVTLAARVEGEVHGALRSGEISLTRLRVARGSETFAAVAPVVAKFDRDAGRLEVTPPLEIRGERAHALGAEADVFVRLELGMEGGAPRGHLSARLDEVTLPLTPPVRGAAAVEASWDGKVVRIASLQAAFAETRLGVEGTISLPIETRSLAELEETPVDLSATLQAVDLSFLRPYRDELRRVRGSVSARLTARGPLKRPAVAGVAELHELELRAGTLPALSSGEARLRLEGETVAVERLDGELGGAPISVTGTISDLGGDPRLDLHATGKDLLLVRTDAGRVRADSDLKIRGTVREPAISGEVRVTEGRFTREVRLLDLRDTIRASIQRVGRGVSGAAPLPGKTPGITLPSFRDEPLAAAHLDVRVTAERPIEIRGNVFRGALRPDVRVLGTGAVPYLDGLVFIERLSLTLPTTTLRIDSGSVRFRESDPFVPELNLVGGTRMLGYEIEVSITGPFSEPTVVLSSTPPLPTEQLVRLVATGQAPGSTTNSSDERLLLSVAQYLGADLLQKLFGGAGDDSDDSIFERLEFESGPPVLEVGRETLEARFRVSRSVLFDRDALYLTGERDDFGRYNGGLRIVVRGR